MSDGLKDIVNAIEETVTPVLRLAEIAQEEILKAQKRYGETGHDGPIWNAFQLLKILHMPDGMQEKVYRAHCAEILDRVAAGEDTRPATAAELLYSLANASQTVPLNAAGTGLYMKLASQVIPDEIRSVLSGINRTIQDYKKLHWQEMESLESDLRKKLYQKWRKN